MEKYGYDLYLIYTVMRDVKNIFLFIVMDVNPPYFDTINKKLNKKNKHCQIENYYDDVYMKGAKDTLDDYTRGITVEGCMKHPIYNHKTIQDEPLNWKRPCRCYR